MNYDFEGFSTLENDINWGIAQAQRKSKRDPDAVVVMHRNGTEIPIRPDSTIQDVADAYHEALEAATKAYRESEEYHHFKEMRAAKIQQTRAEACVLIDEFKTLDMTFETIESQKKLLNWLKRYQPYSDYTHRDKANDAFVIETLERAGFSGETTSMSLTKIPIEQRKDVFFTNIVNYAVNTMRLLAMKGNVVTMVDDWEKKYA